MRKRTWLLIGGAILVALTAATTFWTLAARPSDPALAAELSRRAKADAAAREAEIAAVRRAAGRVADTDPLVVAMLAANDRVKRTDAENTAWLKLLLKRSGWPGRSIAGARGSHDAWLLAQHADADRAFQRTALEAMRALPSREVAAQDIAYLSDRIAIADGHPQLYGTQFTCINGRHVSNNLDDPEKVDRRRRKLGLPSVKEYAETIERRYGPCPAQ